MKKQNLNIDKTISKRRSILCGLILLCPAQVASILLIYKQNVSLIDSVIFALSSKRQPIKLMPSPVDRKIEKYINYQKSVCSKIYKTMKILKKNLGRLVL